MNDPQIWMLIGVFAASTFAMVTLVSTTFLRVLDAKIGGLDAKIDGLGARLDARIDGLEATMDAKFDLLDKDISAIARRVLPDEP